jgi:peptidoglycan/LPS O-acetylase OafA/YrhL
LDVHVRSLDGVRAFAIIAVVLTHAGMPGFEAGWIGVDLFFALSGFLITTLLLLEQDRVGRISYKDFLIRRALRLMPAYLLYVSVITYGIWGWSGSVRSDNGAWTPEGFTLALWTYVVNFAPAGGIWNGQDVTVHLWSLAVEQQYYLIWPVIVVALAPFPRHLLIAGSFLTGAALLAFVLRNDDGLYKTSMLFTRGFTLAMASMCAIAAYQQRERIGQWPWRWFGLPGMAVLMLVFLLSALHLWTHEKVMARLLPFASAAFVLWIAWLWYRPLPAWLAPIMLNPLVQYIGKVSYGVYLYHELVRVAVWYFAKPAMSVWPAWLGYGVRLLLYLGLSVALAALSYELMERKLLKLRRAFRPTGGAIALPTSNAASQARTGP